VRQGQKALLVVALLVVVLAGASLVHESPMRRLLEAVQHHECFLSPKGSGDRTAVGLGDSITAGHHHEALNSGADDSYFDVLACRDGSPITYAGNAGVPGERSDEILARVHEALAVEARYVFVLAGTNDVRQRSTDDTLANLTRIAAAVRDTGARPVFGNLPPSDDFPDETAAFNDELATWADREGLRLLDFWTPLAAEDGTYADGLSGDGVHPSPEGAALLADVAARAVD
jgi:lysophospholipase L1-like esterase